MNCVAYFDLLGTKGFCEDRELYLKNITEFYNNIKQLAIILNHYGKVGIFSDCAYVESSDLYALIKFIVKLRDRLATKQLFFNAVIKSGKLGSNKADGNNTFGVVFTDSKIADLYISHSHYKGIGILVDNELAEKLKKDEQVRFVNSFFVYKDKTSTCEEYKAQKYIDIVFDDIDSERYDSRYEDIMTILLKQWIWANSKEPKFGAYYISIFITLLRSYSKPTFKWNLKTKEFDEIPFVFKILHNILSDGVEEFGDFVGLDFLLFAMLDCIYSCESLAAEDIRDITVSMMSFFPVKSKYRHSLNGIPTEVFEGKNNRERLIKICQEETSNNIISRYMNTQS